MSYDDHVTVLNRDDCNVVQGSSDGIGGADCNVS